jgi:hypothetical protein
MVKNEGTGADLSGPNQMIDFPSGGNHRLIITIPTEANYLFFSF